MLEILGEDEDAEDAAEEEAAGDALGAEGADLEAVEAR